MGLTGMNITLAMIGVPELLVILAILVLIFGAKKLPQLGDAMGQGIRNFKAGMAKGEEEEAELDITPEKKAIDSESASVVKDVKAEDTSVTS